MYENENQPLIFWTFIIDIYSSISLTAQNKFPSSCFIKEHPEAQADHQRKGQAHEEGMQPHVAIRSICLPCQGSVGD